MRRLWAVRRLAMSFMKIITRHERIDVGRLGPLIQFRCFAGYNSSTSQWAGRRSGIRGRSLKAAVNDIDAQDEASQRALDSIINDIENYTERND